jgi:hypothetical protein
MKDFKTVKPGIGKPPQSGLALPCSEDSGHAEETPLCEEPEDA